jgi:hypothetical protein
MSYLPWLTVGVALVDLIGTAYRRFDIDYPECGVCPQRWIAWGTCIPSSGRPEHRFRYFYLRLPFCKIGYNAYQDRECWVQLYVRKFAGKWRYHWVPVPA